jgi:cobalt/nickel transport protein
MKMRGIVVSAWSLFCLSILWSGPALAHFGMIIPSDSMVMPNDNRTLTLSVSFSHPFEGHGMDMERPKSFQVMANGRPVFLTDKLQPVEIMDHKAWRLDYPVQRPGVYVFSMEPEPYWEPAEDCYIVHYTKTVVTAFGDDEGWDREIGLKTEIVPLAKPFGLYSGNVFQGVVKLDGKPVPFAEVEVEYYNEDQRAEAPTDYMVTQTLKADQNGVFSYATPKAGWWGFAALSTSDEKIDYQGEAKDVEIGAVLWIRFHDWQVR